MLAVLHDYVRTDEHPDGWITPEEVTEASAPDLRIWAYCHALLARSERIEAAARAYIAELDAEGMSNSEGIRAALSQTEDTKQ